MYFQNIIVGAGLSGSTLARLLAENGQKVLLVDRRAHIAGNTYDYFDENEITVQKYGPHIFHTNNKNVWDFLCRFSDWHKYEHKVLAYVDAKKVPVPININTINSLYGTNYDESNIQNFYDSQKVEIQNIKNSEDVVISQVGFDLYEKIFKNYTKKQWGVFPNELSKEVIARIPVRTNYDNRYFTDKFQGIPKHGFTRMVENMLNHSNIKILLNTDYKEIHKSINYEKLFFTGCIDEFFDYKFGKLPYRCLEFEIETVNQEFYQEVAVVNYPNDYEYTRITEFKHWTFQKRDKTVIIKEFSKPEGDPYYPIPREENFDTYKKYADEAKKFKNVFFTGRLGKYKYQNMDTVIDESMKLFNDVINMG